MEERLGKKLDPEALKPMLGVHVDYLREALNVIEAKHGSAIAYIDEVLGVGPAGRAALKEKLSV
ncbi:MAG TPA: tyrosine-protein phosphatase [Terricaulis sp.]|nr:tyrosine-protein phosphatase [Terricaulis sp.]